MKIKLEESQLQRLLLVVGRLIRQLARFNDNLERLRIVKPKEEAKK